MKIRSYILSLLIILLLFVGCKKKDYPKDIPQWLKDDIEKYEDHPSPNVNSTFIDEYKIGTSDDIVYFWATYNMEWGRAYFDYYGNLLCSNSGGYGNEDANPLNDTLCSDLNTSELVFVREIWHYNYK